MRLPPQIPSPLALLAALVVAFAAGCAPASDDGTASGEAPPAAEEAVAHGLVADPARLAPGDSVGGFRLESLQAWAITDDGESDEHGYYYGEALFEGLAELSGQYYLFQSDADTTAAPRPCFRPDEATADALPRFPGDARQPWFCFDNDYIVVDALGAATPAGRPATVAIVRYDYVHVPSDVINIATLISGSSEGAPDDRNHQDDGP